MCFSSSHQRAARRAVVSHGNEYGDLVASAMGVATGRLICCSRRQGQFVMASMPDFDTGEHIRGAALTE